MRSHIPLGVADVLFPRRWTNETGANSLNNIRACFNRSNVPDSSPFNVEKWIPRRRISSNRERKGSLKRLEEDHNNRALMTSIGRDDSWIKKSTRRNILQSPPLDFVWIFHCWKSAKYSSTTLIYPWLQDIFSKRLTTRRRVWKSFVSSEGHELAATEIFSILRKQHRTRWSESLLEDSFLFSRISSTKNEYDVSQFVRVCMQESK